MVEGGKALKDVIETEKASMPEWEYEGHEWLGESVSRQWDGQSIDGKIVCWARHLPLASLVSHPFGL